MDTSLRQAGVAVKPAVAASVRCAGARAVSSPVMTVPAHAWVWLFAAGERHLAFTYVDARGELSARGGKLPPDFTPDALHAAVELPGASFRGLPGAWIAVPLDDDERARLQLPAVPSWMKQLAPPPASQPWRTDPALAGKFHPSYPDDLEALFFFHTHQRVERMWVRITDVAADLGGYLAQLLNTPHTPVGLQAGAQVVIRAAPGAASPVWLSDAARDNLARYQALCHDCGFDLLLVPADEIARAQFPGAPEGAVIMQFTTRCAMCRGTMTVEARP